MVVWVIHLKCQIQNYTVELKTFNTQLNRICHPWV